MRTLLAGGIIPLICHHMMRTTHIYWQTPIQATGAIPIPKIPTTLSLSERAPQGW